MADTDALEATKIPITSLIIKNEIINQISLATVPTVTKQVVDDKGITQQTIEQLPDLSNDAIMTAIATTIHICLTKILTSTSINVTGVV